ncbi:MFS transporter [Lacticaseibacillus parakribbianus]|uniref:MFS transporter n=1 Tax=Lacticaseibacillus parakribbianus TaxID=2970927 RepID=UPI0021CB3753|nr:MFS transporter [Lacticaseibacillus parakribbianus]
MSKRNTLIVTIALLLSNAMSGLDGTIVTTALPAIIADLHGLKWMAWIVAIFLLGTAVSTLVWSKLGERVGNKKAYQLAAAFFVVGSFLQGLAPNMLFLILARAIAGIGNGGMISLPYIIYAKLYENPRKRMQVLGLVSAFYSTATIIGPLVGGAIVDLFTWHWVFYINVPIGLLSAILVQVFYTHETVTPSRAKTDYLGAGLMVIGLVSLLGALELVGLTSPWLILLPLAVAAASFAALIKVERAAADPIVPGRLFRNGPLVVDFVLFTIIWGAFMGFLTYSPMWAQALLGTTALIGGATQIPSSVTDIIGSEAVPALRRRFSPHQVLTLNIVPLTLAFVVLVFAGVKAPYWVLLVAGALEGFGNGGCFNELQVKVQQDVDAADMPVATSFSFLIRMLSQTFTTAIFGLLMNQELFAGVRRSHGTITMAMLNKLSDAASVKSLPARLLPQMRDILHNGLHRIMLLALALMLIALVINLWAQRREAKALA